MVARWVVNLLRFLTLVLLPIVLLILPIYPKIVHPTPTEESTEMSFELSWVYMFALAGIYWAFNIVHFSSTSFLITVGIPLLGIQNAKSLAASFMSDHNMLAFGSIVLMMAADQCGLKRRLSTAILKHSGGSMRWIFIDIYLASTWIAMWINSTAAAYFIMQVIDDILVLLKDVSELCIMNAERMYLGEIDLQIPSESTATKVKASSTNDDIEAKKEPDSSVAPTTAMENDDKTSATAAKEDEKTSVVTAKEDAKTPEAPTESSCEADLDKKLNVFGGELLYVCAVAANIGGMLWPFGSPMGRNAMKMDKRYNNTFQNVSPLTEASWVVYSLPLLILNSIVALSYLLWVHFGSGHCLLPDRKTKRLSKGKQSAETLGVMRPVFASEYEALPPFNSREILVLFLMALSIALCITRHPVFIPGWASHIIEHSHLYLGDSVSYIIVVLLYFTIPTWKSNPCKNPQPKGTPDPTVLTWKQLQSNFPYGLLILIGASTCIAKHSEFPVAEPMSKEIVRMFPEHDPVVLRLIMMLTMAAFSIFMPNPGTSLLITQVWHHVIMVYYGENSQAGAQDLPLLLPILSVGSLCFFIPASSEATVLVYKYQGKKTLSAWYFLRVGAPLFLCTFTDTVIYALCWTPDSLLL